ncbi:MAG: ABC transporter permease [Gammaproteobacteria bacterium]|nr:ABC transporter permease [Gammaproteobacteria bacterium]MYF27685.1 ABC transporter permease [Gammaproteobacteria bacterium]MYK45087.1 ABC transporter permease [Gammaproteobacteria bacterium]
MADAPPRARALFVRVAWRNLWRRRLRTWMSAGGIGFAIFLVTVGMSWQAGTYDAWIDTATGLMSGHAQVQHPAYFDNPEMRHNLAEGSDLTRRLEGVPGVVAVAPRAEAFALVSAEERSFGAMVMGVDPVRDAALSDLSTHLAAGEYLPRPDSALVGTALATNLGIELGDEIVVLGSAAEGGVGALVSRVDGLFETGRAEVDRSVLQIGLAAMQAGFDLGDAVHRVVIKTRDARGVTDMRATLEAAMPAGGRLLDWNELLPELEQAIQIDRATAAMTYWLLLLVVAMSVVNAFIMTVFERTREFGMLLAIGMRPNAIIAMLTIEALCVWAMGTIIGIALCLAVVMPLSAVGIDISGIEGMDAMVGQLMMPERLYPALNVEVLVESPGWMLLGTLIAALIPAFRVRRMAVVEALREEE